MLYETIHSCENSINLYKYVAIDEKKVAVICPGIKIWLDTGERSAVSLVML